MNKHENKRTRRKRIGASICAVLVAIAVLAGILYPAFTTVAHAATKAELQKEVDEAKQNTANAKKQLDNVKANKANVEKEVLSIDSEINRTENEIEQTEAAIAQSEADLIIKEQELQIAEQNCMEYDDEFKNRARIMYENRTTSYIEVLLGASSFGDFLSRIELIKEIVEYDKKMLADMIASRNAIAQAKQAIEEEKALNESKRESLATLKEELDYRLESKSLLLTQLQADEEAYKKAYEKAEADEAKVQKELEALAKKEAESGSKTVYTGSGKFQWPVPNSKRITSKYGYRIHPVYKTKKFHSGIDIGAAYGLPIVAAEDGTVVTAKYGSGYGKYIVINHGSGITTLYGHCSSLLVSSGDKVKKGQTIAKIGSTGVSTGNHLHFEVRINGQTADPLTYVSTN
ncbi:MAG: murein hydrolase activator EnvC family protein [Clostridia bacterium]